MWKSVPVARRRVARYPLQSLAALTAVALTFAACSGRDESSGSALGTAADATVPETVDSGVVQSTTEPEQVATSVEAARSTPVPPTATIRTDLDQPVLQLETETDVTLLGFGQVRQPDSASIATWEVAGAAHGDNTLLVAGNESARVWFRGPTRAPDDADPSTPHELGGSSGDRSSVRRSSDAGHPRRRAQRGKRAQRW